MCVFRICIYDFAEIVLDKGRIVFAKDDIFGKCSDIRFAYLGWASFSFYANFEDVLFATTIIYFKIGVHGVNLILYMKKKMENANTHLHYDAAAGANVCRKRFTKYTTIY